MGVNELSSYGPNQAEHFQRVPFERVRLKPTCVNGCARVNARVNAFYAVAILRESKTVTKSVSVTPPTRE